MSRKRKNERVELIANRAYIHEGQVFYFVSLTGEGMASLKRQRDGNVCKTVDVNELRYSCN